MAGARWMFLYRKEGMQDVWRYERLRSGGLKKWESAGWRQVWK